MSSFCYEFETSSDLRAALMIIMNAAPATVARLVEAYPDGRGLSTATIAHLRARGCTLAQATRLVTAFRLVRTCDAHENMRSGRMPE
jgi:hypothetical protein